MNCIDATPTALFRSRRVRRPSCRLKAMQLVVLLTLAASSAFGAPRALLIGMNYHGSAIRPLPGIDLDINLMEQVARDLGITDIRKLWNEQATLNGIRRAVQDLGRGIGRNDLILVYFSGHGVRVPDQWAKDEADGLDEALVPFDARPIGDELENALVDDEVGQLLSGIGTDRLLLIVDACHSGSAARSMGVRAVSKAVVLNTGFQKAAAGSSSRSLGFAPIDQRDETNLIGIMAAQDHESANATRHGSVLTRAIHETISATVKGAGSEITIQDLFTRSNDRVSELMEGLRASQPGLSQHPALYVTKDSERLRDLPLPLGDRVEVSSRLNPPQHDALINKWTTVADQARKRIEMTVPRETFTLHPDFTGTIKDCDGIYSDHLLSIEVVAPEDGYLNVINAGQGESEPIVLFPNEKSTQDNAVEEGQRVLIPAPGANWCLPAASVPAGMETQWVLVVAMFTKNKLNLHQDGDGEGQFRRLSLKSANDIRGFLPAGSKRSGNRADDIPGVAAVATANVLIRRR